MKTIPAPAAAQPPGPVANPRDSFSAESSDRRLRGAIAVLIADSPEVLPQHPKAWLDRITKEIMGGLRIPVYDEDFPIFVVWLARNWNWIRVHVEKHRAHNARPERADGLTAEELLLPENIGVLKEAAAHVIRVEKVNEEVERERQQSIVRDRRLRSHLNTLVVCAARRAPTAVLDRRMGWRSRGRTHRARRRVATRASTGDDAGGEPGEHHAAAELLLLRSIAAAYLAILRSRLRAYRLRWEVTRRIRRPVRGGSI